MSINDPDGGIDARIQAGKVESRWISSGLSVWQFKAGRTITAASILEETQKPGVRKALADSGTYYLVVSADFIPTKINEIKSWLDDAIEQVQPGAPHQLFDASAIAEWATEHPIMLFSFNRPVYDIWSLNLWLERQSLHRIPFRADEGRSAIIKDIQQRFASDDGPIHLRIQGPSGVGKTRLSLETYREYQDDQGMILYAPEPPTKEFFYWMAASSKAHAILVVDETTPAQAARLRSLAEMSEHRLRLLTIGPAEGLGSDIEVYSLKPLSEATLLSIVEATAITLSPEQTRWIARVAKGYVKLATALAKQVARGLTTA